MKLGFRHCHCLKRIFLRRFFRVFAFTEFNLPLFLVRSNSIIVFFSRQYSFFTILLIPYWVVDFSHERHHCTVGQHCDVFTQQYKTPLRTEVSDTGREQQDGKDRSPVNTQQKTAFC